MIFIGKLVSYFHQEFHINIDNNHPKAIINVTYLKNILVSPDHQYELKNSYQSIILYHYIM